MQANEPNGFSPVRACDNVLRLIAELDLEAIQRVASGRVGPRQFESCILEHLELRRRYLQIRRKALAWEERRYGLVRTEVISASEQFVTAKRAEVQRPNPYLQEHRTIIPPQFWEPVPGDFVPFLEYEKG